MSFTTKIKNAKDKAKSYFIENKAETIYLGVLSIALGILAARAYETKDYEYNKDTLNLISTAASIEDHSAVVVKSKPGLYGIYTVENDHIDLNHVEK